MCSNNRKKMNKIAHISQFAIFAKTDFNKTIFGGQNAEKCPENFRIWPPNLRSKFNSMLILKIS